MVRGHGGSGRKCGIEGISYVYKVGDDMWGNYDEIDGNEEWSRTLRRGTTQIPRG